MYGSGRNSPKPRCVASCPYRPSLRLLICRGNWHTGRAEHDFQASRLSITHTRNRCCQAKLEHGREDAAARSEGNPTLRCCAAGGQSSARPTPYQYRPHCRFQDIQTSKRSSLYPYSPCSYSTRREATRRLASTRPICRQDVTEILRNHSVKLPQAMRHERRCCTASFCASRPRPERPLSVCADAVVGNELSVVHWHFVSFLGRRRPSLPYRFLGIPGVGFPHGLR